MQVDTHVADLVSGLNPAQREAVTAPPEHRLVLAGAGSGKTRVLTTRIAHILSQGRARPGEILSVTFTNKAAAEMRQRIEQMLGLSPSGMWVGTFHGLAHRLLRAHWREAKLAENYFAALDEVMRLKPSAAKGKYLKKAAISSSMGPGIKVQLEEGAA